MSAKPDRPFDHNTLWRKFRRRYWMHPIWLLPWLLEDLAFLIPALCMVAWMLRDAGWQRLGDFLRGLWLIGSVAGLLFGLLSLWMRRRYSRRFASRPLPAMPVLPYVIYALTAISLMQGRIDLAVYATFGLAALPKLQKNRSTALLDLALTGAFALNAIWAVVVLLALRLFKQNQQPDFLEIIRQKPGRMEFVREAREQCAAGGG